MFKEGGSTSSSATLNVRKNKFPNICLDNQMWWWMIVSVTGDESPCLKKQLQITQIQDSLKKCPNFVFV